MNFANRHDNLSLKWLAAAWTMLIAAPLIYFPASGVLSGHPWKVELTTSFILAALLSYHLLTRQTNIFEAGFTAPIQRFIVIPGGALIAWSAMSAMWANSSLSVVHHTLVWFVYLVFLIFAVHLAADRKLLRISLIALGLIAGLTSLLCVIEFIGEEKIDKVFGMRYTKYAEIWAMLLPLFLSFIVRLNRRHLRWAIGGGVVLWLGVLFTASRSALLSSLVGLAVFALLRIFSVKTATEKRRLIFAAIGIVSVALLTQISLSTQLGESKGSVVSRLAIQSDKDPGNSLTHNIRLLFSGVGLEMIRERPLNGIGADNFGLEFNRYRAVFSANPDNQANAALQQDLLPERAHNEYLQITAELGIVGGLIFLAFVGGIVKLGWRAVRENRRRDNILTHSAIAGMLAFLFSAAFSSFSFRLMQNGLVFFFLLAILLRNYAAEKSPERFEINRFAPRLKPFAIAAACLMCLSLTVFSALKATSQYFVYAAEKNENLAQSADDYATAIKLDPANAAADYSYGIRLLAANQYPESATHLRRSLEKGLNTDVCYSYLMTAQILSDQDEKAVQTAREAVTVFPYSVFLRVRYARILEKMSRSNEAQNQLAFAANLNPQQAATWQSFINNGASKTTQAAVSDKNLINLSALLPESGIYAVLTEREIMHPEERKNFNF